MRIKKIYLQNKSGSFCSASRCIVIETEMSSAGAGIWQEAAVKSVILFGDSRPRVMWRLPAGVSAQHGTAASIWRPSRHRYAADAAAAASGVARHGTLGHVEFDTRKILQPFFVSTYRPITHIKALIAVIVAGCCKKL